MLFAILIFSKLLILLLRFLKIGGGTSLPGILIEKYLPEMLTKLCSNYEKIILITGTNGKTTTQQFLRHLLETEGLKVCSNASGANLVRGIACTVISDCSIFGKPKSRIAIFEVEEASMPIIAKLVKTDYIIVTNLFRDQLDAYGEILNTRSYILQGIKRAKRAKVFLNGDDPNVCSIASELKNEVLLFSLDDERKQEIFYERDYFKLKIKRGTRKVFAANVVMHSDLSSEFDIHYQGTCMKQLRFQPLGLQSIYSALAASCVAMEIKKFSQDKLRTAFSNFHPVFGRGEIIQINKKYLRLLLIKNPSSFSASLNMLKNIRDLKIMFIINDKIADGRDVSWLWDTNLEILQQADIAWITTSGTRADEMKLRLKYTEIKCLGIETESNIQKALDLSLSKLRDDDMLFILSTYTAMLEMRKYVGTLVRLKKFWKFEKSQT